MKLCEFINKQQYDKALKQLERIDKISEEAVVFPNFLSDFIDYAYVHGVPQEAYITSEGVFGLQRAFKMAGVQTIIMSLWKVHDEATQLLMTGFYTNWIGKKQSKREAFRNAQKVVREQYEDPYYWAGFIMLD